MMKLKNILNEGRPMPMDTPNEFAYLEFKKWAYKNRGYIKKKLLQALGNREDGTKMYLALTSCWKDWASKKANEWSGIPVTPVGKKDFGRELAVMMIQDDLILDKKAWKKDNLITHIKETCQTIKLKSILNEDRFDQSKMFDNSTVKKIANEIKKMIKFEDGFNASFEYKEFRFGDGTGGFSFNWEHSRHKGGNFGLSLGKSGKHYMYCSSYYDKKYTGITSSPGKHFKFKGDPVEWRDFNNDHLSAMWKKAKPMIVKNEKGAQADLDKEAKAQSDYYGSKADTGRIGYGLTSQPRR